jgi:pimeloyl-ACP methyl ester carboxylesterase
MVPVAPGVALHVIEKRTPGDLAEHPRRALLMLPPTLATNAIYDLQVPGDASFDALGRAAREGYLAFAPSYEGYGQSTHPANGATVDAARCFADVSALVEWIRDTHHVARVDVYGMSLGASLAVALGGTQNGENRRHVGAVVLASNVYKSVTPFFQAVFFNPGLLGFLESAPNGYVATDPSAYAVLLGNSDPSAVAVLNQILPGVYATGPTLQGFNLPIFEASQGRAPMLQFWGTADPVTPPEDVSTFQSEYGGPGSVHVIQGGAHSILFEAGRDELWSTAFAFLNAQHHDEDNDEQHQE